MIATVTQASGSGVPEWLIYLSYIGGGLVALGAILEILRRIVMFFVHVGKRVEELSKVMPTVIDIGKEFKTNGGASLRDTVDEIKAATSISIETSGRAATIAAESREAVKLGTAKAEAAAVKAEEAASVCVETRNEQRRIMDVLGAVAQGNEANGRAIAELQGHVTTATTAMASAAPAIVAAAVQSNPAPRPGRHTDLDPESRRTKS